jgi:hypothetical protein
MGEDVGVGFSPWHELAVVPDEAVAVCHRHGFVLRNMRKDREF